MIEKIYKENIKQIASELEDADFPTVIKLCREMLGLKQFAAAEYLGLELHRYKKLETGDIARGAYDEEIERMASLFCLDFPWLKKKHKVYLSTADRGRKEISKNFWNHEHEEKR